MSFPHQDVRFWDMLEQWAVSAELVIERPKGSVHPRYPERHYPLDYGYWATIGSTDDQALDVWVGSATDGPQVVGVLVCVDDVKRDVEMKVLVRCTMVEIQLAQRFNSVGAQACLLLLHPMLTLT
jgi:inorganic pyrophosphatase